MDNGVKRWSISAAVCCYKNSIARKYIGWDSLDELVNNRPDTEGKMRESKACCRRLGTETGSEGASGKVEQCLPSSV